MRRFRWMEKWESTLPSPAEKGDSWYVGAISNWDARNLTLDFSFLGGGAYQATIFKDGVNADRDATDYKKEVMQNFFGG